MRRGTVRDAPAGEKRHSDVCDDDDNDNDDDECASVIGDQPTDAKTYLLWRTLDNVSYLVDHLGVAGEKSKFK